LDFPFPQLFSTTTPISITFGADSKQKAVTRVINDREELFRDPNWIKTEPLPLQNYLFLVIVDQGKQRFLKKLQLRKRIFMQIQVQSVLMLERLNLPIMNYVFGILLAK